MGVLKPHCTRTLNQKGMELQNNNIKYEERLTGNKRYIPFLPLNLDGQKRIILHGGGSEGANN